MVFGLAFLFYNFLNVVLCFPPAPPLQPLWTVSSLPSCVEVVLGNLRYMDAYDSAYVGRRVLPDFVSRLFFSVTVLSRYVVLNHVLHSLGKLYP